MMLGHAIELPMGSSPLLALHERNLRRRRSSGEVIQACVTHPKEVVENKSRRRDKSAHTTGVTL